MPVVYSAGTGTKGFLPCSKVYRQTVSRALQQGDWNTASQLFQQAHRLVWQLTPRGDQYTHAFLPHVSLSPAEYQRIAQLPPQDLTLELLDQQCGATPIRRPTAFVGPQRPMVRRANGALQRIQQLSYEQAARQGFAVQAFKGLATYAPSPFEQAPGPDGIYQPRFPRPQPGQSGGRCTDEGTCQPPSVCQDNTCVLPEDQRQCPPFQHPVELRDATGTFTVRNPSAQRTVKARRYSTFWNQWYNTCLPGNGATSQRWVLDPRLRKYIGLALDVRLIDVDTWDAEAQQPGREILRDPATDAPYFLEQGVGADADNVYRVYRVNSAYTPTLAPSVPMALDHAEPGAPAAAAAPPDAQDAANEILQLFAAAGGVAP